MTLEKPFEAEISIARRTAQERSRDLDEFWRVVYAPETESVYLIGPRSGEPLENEEVVGAYRDGHEVLK